MKSSREISTPYVGGALTAHTTCCNYRPRTKDGLVGKDNGRWERKDAVPTCADETILLLIAPPPAETFWKG